MTRDEAHFLAGLLEAELDDALENLSVNGRPVVVAVASDDPDNRDRASGWYVRIDAVEGAPLDDPTGRDATFARSESPGDIAETKTRHGDPGAFGGQA